MAAQLLLVLMCFVARGSEFVSMCKALPASVIHFQNRSPQHAQNTINDLDSRAYTAHMNKHQRQGNEMILQLQKLINVFHLHAISILPLPAVCCACHSTPTSP
ncbi:hypothetical protein J3459_022463 [Metarhizium acridum]|nr:hypothetical protein J3459_022463 [Metarhizium acridum]